MIKVFIFHGTEGSPDSNWFSWIKEELENLGHKVFIPKFPTPEDQNLENWLKVFEDECEENLDEDSIFIGHSLGCAFILNILERINIEIKSCYLVAGFIENLGNEHFDNLNRAFIDKEFDWEKIKRNCKLFYVINSDDDPYVPFSCGEKISKELNAHLFMLESAGHINLESGFDKFEFLLKELRKELS